MDRLRLQELAYKAQLGQPIEVDAFELSELVLACTEIDQLQGKLESILSDIGSEAGSIGEFMDEARSLTAMALETVEANADNFKTDGMECFTDSFTELLKKIENAICDANASNDEISTFADKGKDDCNAEAF